MTINQLTDGVVYFGDNGRAMCARCAGYTARATGTDLSGHPVTPATPEDAAAFAAADLPFGCECGAATGHVRPLMDVLREHLAGMKRGLR